VEVCSQPARLPASQRHTDQTRPGPTSTLLLALFSKFTEKTINARRDSGSESGSAPTDYIAAFAVEWHVLGGRNMSRTGALFDVLNCPCMRSMDGMTMVERMRQGMHLATSTMRMWS
jgi:hypothetical protein